MPQIFISFSCSTIATKFWFCISVDCLFLIVSFTYTDVHIVSQEGELLCCQLLNLCLTGGQMESQLPGHFLLLSYYSIWIRSQIFLSIPLQSVIHQPSHYLILCNRSTDSIVKESINNENKVSYFLLNFVLFYYSLHAN